MSTLYESHESHDAKKSFDESWGREIAGIGRRVRRSMDRRRVLRDMEREAERADGHARSSRTKTEEVGTMKAIQRIESGICVTIGALLATGWVLAIGELFAHTV